jgi:DNA-binding NarL/FixJ family response regulator
MLTGHGSPVEVEQALRAGAVGYLSKDELGLRLVEIVLGYAGVESRELVASFSAS